MELAAYKKEFIQFMVRSGVLTFGEFITKSGRKTPYFVNTGNYKTGAQAERLGYFYARCIKAHIDGGDLPQKIDALFGPAYKGIPIAVSAAMSLYLQYGLDLNYCFNRKEEKDHGEGGNFIGYRLQDGDTVLMVEDVITAGTAVRETLPLLKRAAGVKVAGMIISVDRMEKGRGEKTAIEEIEGEFGLKTFPIVTVREVIDTLHNAPVDGKIVIDNAIRERMEEYLQKYCV